MGWLGISRIRDIFLEVRKDLGSVGIGSIVDVFFSLLGWYFSYVWFVGIWEGVGMEEFRSS